MQSTPSFLTCRQCQRVQWMTPEYQNRYRVNRCPRCNSNSWRLANVYPTFRDRLYLMRWFVWEQWTANRPGMDGADPYWYLKPHLLWKVLHYGATIMRHYNHFQPGEDHERPRNIENLRAELSQRDPDSDPHRHQSALRVLGDHR